MAQRKAARQAFQQVANFKCVLTT